MQAADQLTMKLTKATGKLNHIHLTLWSYADKWLSNKVELIGVDDSPLIVAKQPDL